MPWAITADFELQPPRSRPSAATAGPLANTAQQK
jgi:hypothetical protein